MIFENTYIKKTVFRIESKKELDEQILPYYFRHIYVHLY